MSVKDPVAFEPLTFWALPTLPQRTGGLTPYTMLKLTSPRYFCTNSEPTTLMKAAVV